MAAPPPKKTTDKDFDAVEMMRGIRDEIATEIEGMSYEQQRDYMRRRLEQTKSSSDEATQEPTDPSR